MLRKSVLLEKPRWGVSTIALVVRGHPCIGFMHGGVGDNLRGPGAILIPRPATEPSTPTASASGLLLPMHSLSSRPSLNQTPKIVPTLHQFAHLNLSPTHGAVSSPLQSTIVHGLENTPDIVTDSIERLSDPNPFSYTPCEGYSRHSPYPCTRTLHPAPRTLHPAPCTLHPAPRTLLLTGDGYKNILRLFLVNLWLVNEANHTGYTYCCDGGRHSWRDRNLVSRLKYW